MPIEHEAQNSGAEQKERHEKTRDGNAGNRKAKKATRKNAGERFRGCCSGESRERVDSRKRVSRKAESAAQSTVAKISVSGCEMKARPATQIATLGVGTNGCGGGTGVGTRRQATAGATGESAATARLATSLASMADDARGEAAGETVPKVKRKRPRKAVRFGTALRKRGIDEHMLADTFVYIFEVLRGTRPAKESDKRLLVEMVKECTKTLEMESKAVASVANAPQPVILVHNVARPQRPALPATAEKSG